MDINEKPFYYKATEWIWDKAKEDKTICDTLSVGSINVGYCLGEYCASDVLEAARSGADERLASLLTPLNVNVHAADGRRSTPLHLAAGYNRARAVRLLLQRGADVHAKDKGWDIQTYIESSTTEPFKTKCPMWTSLLQLPFNFLYMYNIENI